MENSERKRRFVKALAQFLVGLQAGKSIALELEQKRIDAGIPPIVPWAGEWAALRQATPLFGYPTMDEAEEALSEFLGIPL